MSLADIIRQTAEKFHVTLPDSAFTTITQLTQSFIKQQLANYRSVEDKQGPPYVITSMASLSGKRRAMFYKRLGEKVAGLTVAVLPVMPGWFGVVRDYPMHCSYMYIAKEVWQLSAAEVTEKNRAQFMLLTENFRWRKLDEADVVLDVREIDAFIRKSKRDQSSMYLEFVGGDRLFEKHKKDSRRHIRMDEMSDVVSLFGSGKVGVYSSPDELAFFSPYAQYSIEF